jgi:hypothetical protein
MAAMRLSIEEGRFEAWRRETLARVTAPKAAA